MLGGLSSRLRGIFPYAVNFINDFLANQLSELISNSRSSSSAAGTETENVSEVGQGLGLSTRTGVLTYADEAATLQAMLSQALSDQPALLSRMTRRMADWNSSMCKNFRVTVAQYQDLSERATVLKNYAQAGDEEWAIISYVCGITNLSMAQEAIELMRSLLTKEKFAEFVDNMRQMDKEIDTWLDDVMSEPVPPKRTSTKKKSAPRKASKRQKVDDRSFFRRHWLFVGIMFAFFAIAIVAPPVAVILQGVGQTQVESSTPVLIGNEALWVYPISMLFVMVVGLVGLTGYLYYSTWKDNKSVAKKKMTTKKRSTKSTTTTKEEN